MKQLINGLHHLTFIAGDAQENVDFYTGVLGLKMIKKTINFDMPEVYHLYFGDEKGNPGTIMTSFPYGKSLPQGSRGAGQVTYTGFSIHSDALDFWMKRLSEKNIPCEGPDDRGSEKVLRFEDHDGLGLILVANDEDQRMGWANGAISPENAIKGFHGMELLVNNGPRTEALLTEVMQYRKINTFNHSTRYETGSGGPGTYLDLVADPGAPAGREGKGIVHHVAFRTDSEETQLKIRENLVEAGMYVTPVKDRNYFQSIYYREPGGILFEIATDPPGFGIDEIVKELGMSLRLPPWEEYQREAIEKNLPKIKYERT